LEPQLVQLKEEITARREELAEKLKGEAKNIAEQVRPQLEDLKNRIPELTQQYSKTLTEMAPAMADKFRDSAISYLPRLQDKLLKMTEEELAARKPELTRMVDDAVQTLIDQHAQDIATLDSEKLAATLVPAFEEAAGPVLDEFCEGIDLAIVSVRDSLSDLVQKYKTGTLTREEEIELRYIQLWKTYWNVRMEEKIEPVPPLTL
jgi:DNA repair exonuclease SbcCD ATPase subunit